MSYIIAFIIYFIYVFLKASQQLHVMRFEYKWIMPTSMGMGLCEVAIILVVARADTLAMGVCVGLAGGLGCILAMWRKSKCK